MANSLTKKLGFKPGMHGLVIDAPPGYIALLKPLPLGARISSRSDGEHPFAQIFVTRISQLEDAAQQFSKHAAQKALVWVAYPKKASGANGDLNRDAIREEMARLGWNTVSIIAIDDVWSALRFRPATK